jgi:hypothetical protein
VACGLWLLATQKKKKEKGGFGFGFAQQSPQVIATTA